jgi:Tfp pilus assembly protein PilX
MKKYRKGQTLLITLLVLTVAVTVALSLIARATTDIRLTSELEESARAFSAAEAGIEQALKTNLAGSAVVAEATNTKFETSITTLGGNESVYAPDKTIPVGEASTIWLVHHNPDGTLNESDPDGYGGAFIDVCWENGTTVPAMEIAVYYFNSSVNDYFIQRSAYDPIVDRRTDSGFSNVTDPGNGCGMTGVSMQTVPLPVGVGVTPLFLRIRPYYAGTKIFVAAMAGNTLPDQGQIISSTGTTGSGVTRKIEVQREYDTFPSDFDNVLINQNSLEH